MKKLLSILLALTMCLSVMTFTVSAADTLKDVELPKPAQPNYFTAGHAYDSHDDSIVMYSVFDDSLVALTTEYDVDSEVFYKKYGIENEGYYQFGLYMQYDVNIDGKGWQYTSDWDELDGYTGSYYAGYNSNSVRTNKVSKFTFANLNDDRTVEFYGDAVYSETNGNDQVYRFDMQNHSIQIRCRYFLQYRHNDEFIFRSSEWSDVAVLGKGSTQVVPVQPTSYEAPIISELKVVPPEAAGHEAYVYFELDTPNSVWDADMYYAMNGESGMDELDAEISVNNSEWKDLYVSNSHWPLYEGSRQTSSTEMLTSESFVQLRVRYGGPLGYSDWSNVLSVNAPAFEASDWAQAELEKADELGLIPETLEGADLTADITRAEFAAVTVKVYEALLGTPAIPAVINPFTDTNDVEILKAYNIGAVNGTSATTYSPNDLLNREQAAAMLTRVFKKVSIPNWTLATDSQFALSFEKPALFADDADISDWAKDSVYFMVANGIINGVGNNKFAPKNVTSADEANGYANATREQALIIAVRMVENLKK